jgi:hypothetical protein
MPTIEWSDFEKLVGRGDQRRHATFVLRMLVFEKQTLGLECVLASTAEGAGTQNPQ